jgi:hypothetical protein
MAVPSPRLSWYRSFYWRIGITFVASVVVVLITQGVILRRTPRAAPFDVFQGNVLAATVATDVADVLRRGQEAEADLNAHLKSRYPPADETKWGWTVFVALRHKIYSSTGGPVPSVVPLTALSAFGRRRLTPADGVTPVASAPVVVDGRFEGLAFAVLPLPWSGRRGRTTVFRFLARSRSSSRCRARSC